MVKGISDTTSTTKVSKRRVGNLAKLYAWCVAKDVLSLTMLKVSLISLSSAGGNTNHLQFSANSIPSTQTTNSCLPPTILHFPPSLYSVHLASSHSSFYYDSKR